MHKVKPGEYLSFIAGCYDVTWRQLYWRNRGMIGSDPDLIRPNMKLVIPPHDYDVPNFEYHPTAKPGVVSPHLACPPGAPGHEHCD